MNPLNRWLALTAIVAVASTAHAQGRRIQTPGGQTQVGVWGYRGRHGDYAETRADHRLVVERDPLGRTRIKVLGPEGAMLHIYENHREVYTDDIPTVFDVQPNRRYRIEVDFPDGSRWREHVRIQQGAVARLWVLRPGGDFKAHSAVPGGVAPPAIQPAPPPPPAPAAPQPMARRDFKRLKQAIKREPFARQKLGVLETAASHAYFTIRQLGELVDLYTFADNKVQAVKLVRPHVVDPQNAFLLSAHFTFASNKDAVQQMFR